MYSGSVYIVDTLVARLARVALETPGTPAVFQRRVWRSRPPKLATSFIKVQSAVIMLYHEKAALLLHVASSRRVKHAANSRRTLRRARVRARIHKICFNANNNKPGERICELVENLPPPLSLPPPLASEYRRARGVPRSVSAGN